METHRIRRSALVFLLMGVGLAVGARLAGAPDQIASTTNVVARTTDRTPALRCDSLTSLHPIDTVIDTAVDEPGGDFAAPGETAPVPALPAFCRVAATYRPSSDSDITIEVWLPRRDWNGKLEAVGNGGWSGSINVNAMADALRRGYAAASTDTGHKGSSAAFALGHPEKLIDFGYRSEHGLAVVAKTIAEAYFGAPPSRAYWNGCSAGGRQGLMEAQRYPEDFDGIVAGAPAADFTGRAIQSIWIAQAVHKDGASAIPTTKFAVIHAAVLASCDALDGVGDGVLEDPTRCHFDPATIACPAGRDGPSCLTTAEVATARAIYGGAIDAGTGAVVFPGHEPGSEFGWTTMAGPQPFAIGLDLFRYVIFGDPQWDFRRLNFDGDVARARRMDAAIDALDPNLDAFVARGGKLIQYHGWSDPQISPRSSVLYHQRVVDRSGDADAVARAYRLFMVPGMAHCGGGEGPNHFDMVAALEQWVENGRAPDRIIASRVTAGRVDRTRPLCPYPQVARYRGAGSVDEAASFVCGVFP